MTRHPRRVIPAILVALIVLAASVLAVISVSQNLAHVPQLVSLELLNRHLGGLHLDGMVMTTLGVLAAVFGLILLGYALLPGPAQTLALADVAGAPGDQPPPGGEAVAGVSRTGLRAALADIIEDTDGVDAVRVRVGRRRVDVRVRTELTDTTALRAAADRAARRRLEQVGLARPLDVRMRVRTIRRGAVA